MCYFETMMNVNPVMEILRWHLEVGADETISDTPVDRFALVETAKAAAPAPLPSASPPPPVAKPAAPVPASDEWVKSARDIAAQANDLDSLRQALAEFDGCGLKKTATNLVFVDGNPSARLMLVGEAPGAQEDRQGLPFVGPSGELLNRMLASIGIDRKDVLISNTVFWRPPGNRTPTTQETAICLPFMQRLIELVAPDVLVTLGGPAAKTLLGEPQAVGRLRGRWFTYKAASLDKPIDATALFHPAYLLRTPTQKRATWQDLLMIRKKLYG